MVLGTIIIKMGYLLKIDEKVLMFYSEPQYGYYRGERTCISAEVYGMWLKEDLTDDMVWIENEWYDTSASGDEARGVEVSEFVVDCILQGRKLKPNKPLGFNCV